MFGRKYTFESKSTRLRRIFIGVGSVSLITLALIISFIVYIPIYAKMQKGRAAGAFFQKSPDAIAVFTGDRGRISYAFELMTKNPSAKLFISGVYAANSFQNILNAQANPATGEAVSQSGMQFELDYISKNTFQNVVETVKFLSKNPDLNKVLIISSDYHIMRIKLIISHFIKGKKPEIYFDSISGSYTEWKDVKKLLKESIKIVRSYIQLNVLGEKSIIEDTEENNSQI
ncbi:MAG: ElyC/SanA/YdcF family protein [Bdellovibrionota bacterium]